MMVKLSNDSVPVLISNPAHMFFDNDNDDFPASRCKNLDIDLGDISRPCILKRNDDNILLEEDRISSLPDSVLGDILSLVPSKDAFSMGVLLRRSRRVFTWVTCLDFDDSPISHCIDSPCMINSFPNFKNFVDKLLQLCQSHKITTYKLHFGKSDRRPLKWHNCGEGCFPELEPKHLNAWMRFPLSRQVEELDIRAHVRKPDQLLMEIFGCQTLEVLKLDVNLHLQLPSSFCLPNLKEFHLTLPVIPNGDFVTRIVSSCPSLQHLALYGYWDPLNPIEISSLSLRRLNIFVCNWSLCQRTKFVLDVPNLEYLAYRDVSALHYSIGHMNAVVEAKVNIKDCLLETIVSLAWLLPNVQCLFIGGQCVQPMQYCESKLKLPIFENLKHLKLGCFGFCDWNRVLMELLNCSPLLETLAFPEGITDTDDHNDYIFMEVSERECNLWSSTETVPSCLVSHLKKMTVGCYMYTYWEKEMFKYFLRSSLVLEELDIYINCVLPKAAWIGLDRRLDKLRRASKTCSVRFHNVQFRAVFGTLWSV